MKKFIRLFCTLLTGIIVTTSCSCSQKKDYSGEYNYETDCQYTYCGNIPSWKYIQSDGSGQYIYKKDFIYYYNMKNHTMTPLCNKANCLHDKETSDDRREECNAYCLEEGVERMNNYIQYYEGNIYYADGDSLYRLSADGSKKDVVFSTEEDMLIYDWLLHRGIFYYVTEPYYTKEGDKVEDTQGEDEEKKEKVYKKCILKAIPVSSSMKEKDAEVIFENDNKHNVLTFGPLKAYKNYICYGVIANQNDFKMTTNESWIRQVDGKTYMYNTETKENKVIPCPEGYSDTTGIANVVFLKDKILVKLYDDLEKEEYKLPIYSMNYDLTGQKIWLDQVEQGKTVQSYEDYVIITDGDMQYFLKGNQESANIEIYNEKGERISYFVYPFNVLGNFNGFGPDGINVEFKETDDSLAVYELPFDKVKNCHGETVEPELVAERAYKVQESE